jgi:hypothetical protein
VRGVAAIEFISSLLTYFLWKSQCVIGSPIQPVLK